MYIKLFFFFYEICALVIKEKPSRYLMKLGKNEYEWQFEHSKHRRTGMGLGAAAPYNFF